MAIDDRPVANIQRSVTTTMFIINWFLCSSVPLIIPAQTISGLLYKNAKILFLDLDNDNMESLSVSLVLGPQDI